MTPERLEELVEIGANAAQLSTSDFDKDHVRAALTAVYPLIRDDVIEEIEIDLENCMGCAINEDDQEVSQYYRNVEELRDYFRALKSKDTKL